LFSYSLHGVQLFTVLPSLVHIQQPHSTTLAVC
jgi:hypothetical protein